MYLHHLLELLFTHCSLTTDLCTGCAQESVPSSNCALCNFRLGNEASLFTDTWGHTADNLAVEIQAEWGLEGKAYGCTTDNASNITQSVVNQQWTRFASNIHCTSDREMYEQGVTLQDIVNSTGYNLPRHAWKMTSSSKWENTVNKE